MITNLKDAKARLSEYVELAAGGEDVVITVRGKAKARLCPIQEHPATDQLAHWGKRLEEARARYKVRRKGKPETDQDMWDTLRGDRE